VDQPGTQAWKRQRLVDLGYGVPGWLRLVPVDFEAGASWHEEVAKAGFDAARPAVVASTGVSHRASLAPMTVPFPEPTAPAGSRAEVFGRYLDFFRDRVVMRLRALPDGELRRSRLPSGWTPVELLRHLTFDELRWLEWRFEGRDVADPWGDNKDDRWYVAPEETLDGLLAALAAQAERSRRVIAAHDLDEVGVPGERWGGGPPATLERVLFHLLQEYARHLGHLDIVSELAGGTTGE